MTRRKVTEADVDPLDRLRSLSPAQSAAVDLVALGKSDQDVGAAVGVTRQTVNVWRLHHPAFAVAVEARRREAWSAATDGLRAILPKAVKVLGDALDGPDGWRVALSLVRIAGVVHGDYGLKPFGPDDVAEFVTDRAKSFRHKVTFGESASFVETAWSIAACQLADEEEAAAEVTAA